MTEEDGTDSRIDAERDGIHGVIVDLSFSHRPSTTQLHSTHFWLAIRSLEAPQWQQGGAKSDQSPRPWLHTKRSRSRNRELDVVGEHD